MMRLGAVYLVFAPSLITTLLAGRVVAMLGVQRAVWASTAVAVAGLPPLLGDSLPAFLAGLALVACGTFAAQAAVTGFVGRAAAADRGAASGIYLACYFSGGLVGSAVLGPVFDRLGWAACVGGIARPRAGRLVAPALGLRGLAAVLRGGVAASCPRHPARRRIDRMNPDPRQRNPGRHPAEPAMDAPLADRSRPMSPPEVAAARPSSRRSRRWSPACAATAPAPARPSVGEAMPPFALPDEAGQI